MNYINISMGNLLGIFLLVQSIVWVNVLLIHYFVNYVIESYGLKPTASFKRISNQGKEGTVHYKDLCDTTGDCTEQPCEKNEDDFVTSYSSDMGEFFEYPEEELEEEHYTSFLYNDDVEIVTPEQELEMERRARK